MNTNKGIKMKDIKVKLIAAADQLISDVGSTMGINGYNVSIMAQSGMAMRVTKDGATVAENSHNDDMDINGFIKSITEVAKSVESEVGDGTTSATVMSCTLIKSLLHLVDEGHHPRKIIRDLDSILDELIASSALLANPTGPDMANNIAMVSTNHDVEMSKLVVGIVNDIGPYGRFKCTVGKGDRDIHSTNNGYTIDTGIISPILLGDDDKPLSLEAPVIILREELTVDKVLDIITSSGKNGYKNVVVVCNGVSEDNMVDVLNVIIQSMNAGGVFVYPIELSGVPSIRNSQVSDITHISPNGVDVIMESNRTTFKFDGNNSSVMEYIASVEASTQGVESGFDLEIHKTRIMRLRGGYATIMASGTTTTESKERRDRINDAILATQSALREGYIIGGGNHYLELSRAIIGKSHIKPYLKNAIESYLSAIFQTIHINSGVSNGGLEKLYNIMDDIGSAGQVVEQVDFSGSPSIIPLDEYVVVDSAGTPPRIFEATRSIIHTLLPVSSHIAFNPTKFTI